MVSEIETPIQEEETLMSQVICGVFVGLLVLSYVLFQDYSLY